MFREISVINQGEAIYCERDSRWSRTLYSGATRETASILVVSKFKLDRQRVFFMHADCGLGEFDIHMNPLGSQSRWPFIQPSSYEGSIVMGAIQIGAIRMLNSLSEPLIKVCCQNGDVINVARRSPREPYSEYILSSESDGVVAVLYGEDFHVTLRELFKSRFGFGKVQIGEWRSDGGLFSSSSSSSSGSDVFAAMIGVMLLMETIVTLAIAQTTSTGS